MTADGQGLAALPIPISTPGFDAAPYLTATGVITRDPDSRVQNMGTYRGQLKAPARLGMMMLANIRAGGLEHWRKYRARGQPMPVAIIVGAPPLVAFQGPQKLRLDLDELSVAGGLAGGAINVVRGRTVDLLVPAEAELVIEGEVDTDCLEPEGPFGESHGYVALEDYNTVVRVTAITRRRDAILTSIISQVTPSESSVVKRLAYEPMFLAHLRDRLGIASLRRVALHEPLTNLRRIVLLQFAPGAEREEIWRALNGTLTLQAAIGKFVIAIDEDIDPDNADAVFWAMSYRCNPATDMHIVPLREAGHGPRTEGEQEIEFGAPDRCDDEAQDAAGGAAGAGIHGEREGAVGAAGPAEAPAADAVARLFAGRLDRGMGRQRRAGHARRLGQPQRILSPAPARGRGAQYACARRRRSRMMPRPGLANDDKPSHDGTMMAARNSAATAAPAILLSGVDKWFKTQDEPVHALASTDLAVATGEMVVLLGPSGCGKTTLLRIVAGLTQPTKGVVRVLGRDLWVNDTRQSDVVAGMGIVFQDANLFPWLSIEGNITLPLELKGARQGGAAGARARAHAARRHCRVREALAARAVGRHAPARGDRARAVLQSGHPA